MAARRSCGLVARRPTAIGNVGSPRDHRSAPSRCRLSLLSLNRLFTIGHSTRSVDELVELLQEHDVTQLVDVRHFPMSRRNPQVNREALERELPARGIAYFWEGETLGGFRKGGYEPYMQTDSFREGLERLERLLENGLTAIMCAEIVWFRCHRRFIARQMAARGYRVTHIVNRGKPGYEEPLPPDTQPPRIRSA